MPLGDVEHGHGGARVQAPDNQMDDVFKVSRNGVVVRWGVENDG